MTMRYRKLDAAGDYVFGNGQADFYRDQPEAVAQAVQTRLALFLAEWFLDTADGTPWNTQVLGERTGPLYDLALRNRVLGTPNVTAITAYASQFNPQARAIGVQVSVETAFSVTPVVVPLVTMSVPASAAS
ncbi:MAG: hypothetical protein ACRYHQ_40250 [Janthinobacterium lividum]